MESKTATQGLIHKLNFSASPLQIFIIALVIALVGGISTGYILASTSNKGGGRGATLPLASNAPKSAQQDNQTFKDFAEGTIQKKPIPKNGTYTEGTHLLIRTNAVPVALTSSVVDLTQYEGKKVKVFGETQKAIEEGWLMDVGKVEVE